MLKRKLLEESIKKHQSVIEDFNARLGELKESERLANQDELDGGQFAQKVQMDSEVMMLNTQLEFAIEEMNRLQRLKSVMTIVDEVTLGAVVVTDRDTFYVSSSIEQFRHNGKEYIGLSTHSPLYKIMKGKRKGEKFTFNGLTYLITDVF